MELKDKEVIKRGITVNSPSSDYEPTIGGFVGHGALKASIVLFFGNK